MCFPQGVITCGMRTRVLQSGPGSLIRVLGSLDQCAFGWARPLPLFLATEEDFVFVCINNVTILGFLYTWPSNASKRGCHQFGLWGWPQTLTYSVCRNPCFSQWVIFLGHQEGHLEIRKDSFGGSHHVLSAGNRSHAISKYVFVKMKIAWFYQKTNNRIAILA